MRSNSLMGAPHTAVDHLHYLGTTKYIQLGTTLHLIELRSAFNAAFPASELLYEVAFLNLCA